MKLREWNMVNDFSSSEYNRIEKYLDCKIIKEYAVHNKGFISWKSIGGSHKFVYSWILLENGIAIGWNENPARGFSFPIIKNVKI